ncbi:hypothetical protein L9F63_014413, partial [Diploptera punctata]
PHQDRCSPPGIIGRPVSRCRVVTSYCRSMRRDQTNSHCGSSETSLLLEAYVLHH